MEINKIKTGKRIGELMKRDSITCKELALKLCLSQSAVKNYISGNSIPKLETLEQMVNIFHLRNIYDIIIWEKE